MHADSEHGAVIHSMIRAAQQAGEFLQKQQAAITPSRKGPDAIDVVTAADQASQRMIQEQLKRDHPEYGFMGEEGEGILPAQPWYFCVDPLDGTANYTLPEAALPWAVSIALVEQKDGVHIIHAGVIAIPLHDQIFWADNRSASGLRLNRHPSALEGSAARGEDLRKERWCFHEAVGHCLQQILPPAHYQRDVLEFIAFAEQQNFRLRNHGAMAVDMARAAQLMAQKGHAICYAPAGYGWDFAAGVALIRAAGGQVLLKPANGFMPVANDKAIIMQGLQQREINGVRYPEFLPLLAGSNDLLDVFRK